MLLCFAHFVKIKILKFIIKFFPSPKRLAVFLSEKQIVFFFEKEFIRALFTFRTIKYIKESIYLNIMETFEKILEEVVPRKEEARSYLATEKPLYEGLRKVEDKVYASGTSIKYWM